MIVSYFQDFPDLEKSRSNFSETCCQFIFCRKKIEFTRDCLHRYQWTRWHVQLQFLRTLQSNLHATMPPLRPHWSNVFPSTETHFPFNTIVRYVAWARANFICHVFIFSQGNGLFRSVISNAEHRERSFILQIFKVPRTHGKRPYLTHNVQIKLISNKCLFTVLIDYTVYHSWRCVLQLMRLWVDVLLNKFISTKELKTDLGSPLGLGENPLRKACLQFTSIYNICCQICLKLFHWVVCTTILKYFLCWDRVVNITIICVPNTHAHHILDVDL